jgi:hypothetical protein
MRVQGGKSTAEAPFFSKKETRKARPARSLRSRTRRAPWNKNVPRWGPVIALKILALSQREGPVDPM